MEKADKLKFFINEINDIKSEKHKKFAEELIGRADDYFFVVPASSSGKYHPQFDLGKGGLVKHTRCVAFFAKAIAESLDLNENDTDLLIISALAHDIKKQGNNMGHTVREHPILASTYVNELADETKLLTATEKKKICGAILSHMGKWEHHEEFLKYGGEPYPMPKTEFEKALQAADYIASRKEIIDFNFRPTDTNDIVVEPTRNVTFDISDPGSFIITFGKKYANMNMSIREIHEKEKKESPYKQTYIEWMANVADFHFVDAQEMAIKYLESLSGKPSSSIDEKNAKQNVETSQNVFENNPFVSQQENEELPF